MFMFTSSESIPVEFNISLIWSTIFDGPANKLVPVSLEIIFFLQNGEIDVVKETIFFEIRDCVTSSATKSTRFPTNFDVVQHKFPVSKK